MGPIKVLKVPKSPQAENEEEQCAIEARLRLLR